MHAVSKMQGQPKVSIITCVYNGEKYITKLLDSVLNMGYKNIEHIIVNDGSTDGTDIVIKKYIELYKNKNGSNLYIKYIKQDNIGLGGATNVGLKNITGEYFTWINCDDWYEEKAFFGPIEILEKKHRLDYVQLNGYDLSQKNRNKTIRIRGELTKIHFNNPRKLYIDFCSGTNFRYLLWLCRVSSYKSICPSMSIYPSRYTQDIQFCTQLFPLLKGDFYSKPVYTLFLRDDSFYEKNKGSLYDNYYSMVDESIEYLRLKKRSKNHLKNVNREEKILNEFKRLCVERNTKQSWEGLFKLLSIRKTIGFLYYLNVDHRLILYYIYSLFRPKN